MSFVEDLVLGLVQGLTEFLPVSSSGHLVVVPALLGWEDPSVSFDLVLHVGTLLAVLVYFRADLGRLARGLVGQSDNVAADRTMIGYLAAATVPAGVAGLAFGDFFETLFEEPLWVCAFWTVTAAVLVTGERIHQGTASRALTLRTAVIIGSAQAVALAPGISRSGATIAVGLALGLPRLEAARFAFLLAIPAIVGGAVTLVPDVTDGTFDLTPGVAAGFGVAAVSGYVAVSVLLRLVRTRSLAPFALYLVIAAPLAALAL